MLSEPKTPYEMGGSRRFCQAQNEMEMPHKNVSTRIASILFLLTSLVVGLGAFGHDSHAVRLAAEFAKYPDFDARTVKIVLAVWHFCSGCMLVFGAILVRTWWRIRQGRRDLFAPCAIGGFYIASGALTIFYTGAAFFWLFVALGALLVVTAWMINRNNGETRSAQR